MYVYTFVDVLFNVLTLAIFARVLLSWFPMAADNPIGRVIYDVTEPILGPLRRIIPSFGMLDISPLVALLLLQVLRNILLASLAPY